MFNKPAWITVSIFCAAVVAGFIVHAGCERHDASNDTVVELNFVDLSKQTGLPQSGHTTGAVYVDLDDDGTRDLLIGRHNLVPEAFRNDGNLQFVAMPEWGNGMAAYDHHATLADDINGDGKQDFYFVVGAHRGRGIGVNTLYLSGQNEWKNGGCTWAVSDSFGRGRGALLLDTDQNGLPNLFVLNFRTAPRSFEFAASPPAVDVVTDCLGIPSANDSIVALGASRKREEFIDKLLPIDLDSDSEVDYLAFGGGFPLKLLRPTSSGIEERFEAIPVDAYFPPPKNAVWGDFDGDSHPDLYLVYGMDDEPSHFRLTRTNRLLLWRKDRFEDKTPSELQLNGRGTHCVAADFDNSGTLDIAVLQTNSGELSSRLKIFLNNDNGEFIPIAYSSGAGDEMIGIADGILAEDLDADGWLDLLVLVGDTSPEEFRGGVRVFHNTGAGNHWLAIDLGGGGANLPYGTIVKLVADDRVQVQQFWPTQVRGSAYRSQLHFGLGASEEVSELELTWPSGKTKCLRGVSADQVLFLSEGE